MKKIILGLVGIAAIIFVMFNLFRIGNILIAQDKIVKISDVAQKTEITLSTDKTGIHALHILITGHIDGEATIRQGNSNVKHTYERKAGDVNLPIQTDWYENNCVIEYEPVDVKSGDLSIRYKFENIREFQIMPFKDSGSKKK